MDRRSFRLCPIAVCLFALIVLGPLEKARELLTFRSFVSITEVGIVGTLLTKPDDGTPDSRWQWISAPLNTWHI